MIIVNGKEKWAKHFNKCKKCKLTTSRHVQHGFCSKCWESKRYYSNKKYYSDYYKKRWRERHPKEIIKNKD